MQALRLGRVGLLLTISMLNFPHGTTGQAEPMRIEIMLGLTLREEFRGKRLKGTAIELSNDSNTGATQIAARRFLDITYPTHDLGPPGGRDR